MDSFQQLAPSRHEYRLKTWQRVFFLLLGAAAIVGGAFLAWKITSEPGPGSSGLALTMLLFPLLGLYLLAWALRSRLIIDGTRIEVRGALKESIADLSEIEGYRIISTRNGTYTLLCLKEGRGKITVSHAFDTDDDYRAFFQQLTDLDKRDKDAVLDEISKDAELGSTPEERLAALKKAKLWNIITVVVAVAAAIGLNFGADSLHLLSALALALAPVVVFFWLRQSPLLYVAFKRKSDPRADVGGVLLASGFGLALGISRFEFVSLKPLVLLMVIVGLAYIGAFFNSVRKGSPLAATIIALLVVAASYSFGLAIVADTLLDKATASTYIVPVTGKHLTSGKSTTYYLDLAPWGPLQEPNKISVSSSFYSDISAGDEICLALHPGRLHAAWYHLAACPAEPAQQPTE
jgi:hypothetical protein